MGLIDDLKKDVNSNKLLIEDFRTKINDIVENTKNIDSEKERVDNIIEEIKELDDTITNITSDIEINNNQIDELQKATSFDRTRMDESKHMILEIDSKLKDLDATSTDRFKKAEENIKTNDEQIQLLDGPTKYISEQINNLSQTNILIDAKIQELNGKSQEDMQDLESKLKNLEEGSKYNVEKIISIEEAMLIQSEKLQYIQILDNRMKVMDEEKQKSDAKAREDLDESTSKNSQAIEGLKKVYDDKFANITSTNIEINETVNNIHNQFKEFEVSSSDRLKKAEDNIQTNSDQIGLLDGSTKYITGQINNIFQTNITIDEKINQTEELRQKSDTKIKAEFDNLIQELNEFEKKNNKKIQDLSKKTEIEFKDIEEEVKELDDAITGVTPEVKKNTERLNELDKAKEADQLKLDETKQFILEINNKLTLIDEEGKAGLKNAEEGIRSNNGEIDQLKETSKHTSDEIKNII